MSGDSFTFPSLPAPRQLPPQNPLLAKATVVDRTRGGGNTTSSSSGSSSLAMGAGQSVHEDGGAAAAAPSVVGKAELSNKKVPKEKGYSQMDWTRLTKGPVDFSCRSGGPPRQDITAEEVAKHNTPEDGWTVLRGKVYNLGPYLKYHPGGERILERGALGRDCTALFNKNHAWVNADMMLAKCLVGTLAATSADGK